MKTLSFSPRLTSWLLILFFLLFLYQPLGAFTPTQTPTPIPTPTQTPTPTPTQTPTPTPTQTPTPTPTQTPTPTPTQTPTPIPPPPIGDLFHWEFDEGSGSSLYDDSGNAYDATIYGATWVDGILGNALEFDGVDDYVEVEGIETGEDKFSATLWFDGPPGQERIIMSQTDSSKSTYYYSIETTQDDKARFRLRTNGTLKTLTQTVGTLSFGSWIHFTAIYDGTNMSIYIGTVLVATMPVTGTIDKPPVSRTFLCEDGNPVMSISMCEGKIDSVSVFQVDASGDIEWVDSYHLTAPPLPPIPPNP